MLEPATTLDDVHKTLSPEPLMTPPRSRRSTGAASTRSAGETRSVRWRSGLERSWGAGFYKAFLTGHPGVGKLTEMTRLVEGERPIPGDPIPGDKGPRPGKLQAVRRLAPDDDQGRGGDGEAGQRRRCGQSPVRGLLQEVRTGSPRRRPRSLRACKTAIEGRRGSAHRPSVWHKVLGLFANVKGEIKYTADRAPRRSNTAWSGSRLDRPGQQASERMQRTAARRHGITNGCSSARNSIGPGSGPTRRGFLLELLEHLQRNSSPCDLHDPDRPGLFREERRSCRAPAIESTSSRTRRCSTASTRNSRRAVPPFRRSWRRGSRRNCLGRADEAVDRRLGGKPA